METDKPDPVGKTQEGKIVGKVMKQKRENNQQLAANEYSKSNYER